MMISLHNIVSYFKRNRDFYVILIINCFLTVIATIIIKSNDRTEIKKGNLKDGIKDSYSIDSLENNSIIKPASERILQKKGNTSQSTEFSDCLIVLISVSTSTTDKKSICCYKKISL